MTVPPPDGENYDDVITTSTNVHITVRELYDLVYIRLLSDSQIARLFGLTAKTIRNWRRKVQFDTVFKTGTMDLPLHRVRQLVNEGKSDADIAAVLNTTKTSVILFRRRHELNPENKWPIDRKRMADLILAEFTNQEIAKVLGVDVQDVEKFQEDNQLAPFCGVKKFMRFGTIDPDSTVVNLEITLYDHAKNVLKSRFRYNNRMGFIVDGRPVNAFNLMRMVGYNRVGKDLPGRKS